MQCARSILSVWSAPLYNVFPHYHNRHDFRKKKKKFLVALRPNAGHGLFIHEVARSHTTTHHTPLDDGSARRRDLYLTTHNTHNRQTSMPPAGFEPTISAGERPQTYALDRAAAGTGTTILN